MQSRVDELEQLNQAMRDRDKLKDDAITHLSDQLIALTARLDSIEVATSRHNCIDQLITSKRLSQQSVIL
jgi:hypothetical protein